MDRNAQLIYRAAKKMGLPITFLPEIGHLNIKFGGKNYYFYRTCNPLNKGASIIIAKNKYFLNKILKNAGFPVPKAVAFNADDFSTQPLVDLIQDLKFPLVAKPMTDTGRGENVLCNIKDMDTLSLHINEILKMHAYIQVEEFHQHLREYRVLVLKNRVIGVVERFSASITGDGNHTIEELIELSNIERNQLSVNLTISPLLYDEEYKHCLAEQNLSLQSIPNPDEKVRLCYTVNTGRGGEILSLGKKIHPINAKYLCRAAKVAGLSYVGFDVICEDINLPFDETKWVIIEANFNPDITIHEIPHRGAKAPVVNKILRQLIYKHPLSYVSYLCMRSRWSVYTKGIFCLTIFYYLPKILAHL